MFSGVEMASYARSAKPAILWMVQMGKLLNKHKKRKGGEELRRYLTDVLIFLHFVAETV